MDKGDEGQPGGHQHVDGGSHLSTSAAVSLADQQTEIPQGSPGVSSDGDADDHTKHCGQESAEPYSCDS